MVSRGGWDAVVVGGGLVGSSVAYQLVCRGMRTLLVEQDELSSGASGANFGLIQVQDCELGLSLELTAKSVRLHQTLEAELECDLERGDCGYLLLLENEQQKAIIEKRAVALLNAGVAVELLDHASVQQLEPSLAPDTFIGALYDPYEGFLNPFALVRAYISRGLERELEIRLHTRVTGIEVVAGRVAGVRTCDEVIATDNVVLSTGAWTSDLARRIGLDLPIRWLHGEALVTGPLPRVVHNTLMTASFFETVQQTRQDKVGDTPTPQGVARSGKTVGFCLTQRPSGHLLVGESSCVADVIGSHSTSSAIPSLAAEAIRRLPILRCATVLRTWGANVLFTNDRRPLVGPIDGLAGLFFATGLKSTIVLTPLVGTLVADMVTNRTVDSSLKEFSPMRLLEFGHGRWSALYQHQGQEGR